MTKNYGPKTRLAKELHALKYCTPGESFEDAQTRFANVLADDPEHFRQLLDILRNQRFMGGGRTQLAIGAAAETTAFNCFVSGKIEDSFDNIMDRAKEAGQTMRKGGGIGYDFSTLRPKGALISTLGTPSSGPISFMQIYDALCKTVSSAGHRRGAQMGVLRIDHPDIEEFINAKQNSTQLTAFNLSIAVTDEFMEAVKSDSSFELKFEGVVHKHVKARQLWEQVMRSTWDWAEPGVLFIDRINEANNLAYCETIAATNPCGEQPLPPYGACLLGSYNLTKYIKRTKAGNYIFDYAQLTIDIPVVTRAMDNIHDNTIFPLEKQRYESVNKRRIGIGVTGLANAIEALGHPYGSQKFLNEMLNILTEIRDITYLTSIKLAEEKGYFPCYNAEEYAKSEFIQTLPKYIRTRLKKHGIRNSHLLSIAPTGTISLTADNVSGGIEPVFSLGYDRVIQTPEGPVTEKVWDYGYKVFGTKGRTADECTASEHLSVLALATRLVDSACSKTINVSPDLPWADFKAIYTQAWKLGCKGCTTFNVGGKRFGILIASDDDEAKACSIDPLSGHKDCS